MTQGLIMVYDDFPTLRIDLAAKVAWVKIENPPLNIMDAALMTDLDRFAGRVRTDASVRVIVFQSGDPDFFIPHGDMGFVDDPSSFASLAIGAGDAESADLNPMQRLHERVRRLPQVTIGKIAGFARGGGAEFLEALDMRFAALGKGGLAQMEAPTGIVPGGGATAYLPRLMGRARSLEVILGAGLFDAALAERYGWINRAIPAEDLDGFVDDLARRIAALPPGVIAATKSAVDAADGPLSEALHEENIQLGLTFAAPAAAALTRTALRAGAQTREGEKDLERLLSGLAI
jgi:enoyl-CoA hydratase/carnithine racemase